MEQPPKGQLQLYPEYITNNPTVSISAAPVMYQRPNAADEEKKEAEVKLAFPVTPRQLSRGGKRPTKSKGYKIPTTWNSTGPSAASAEAGKNEPQKSLDEWEKEQVDTTPWLEQQKEQQLARRKKQKKNKRPEHAEVQIETNWDAPYDLRRGSNYCEYRESVDFYRMTNAWKRHVRQSGVPADNIMMSEDAAEDSGMANNSAEDVAMTEAGAEFPVSAEPNVPPIAANTTISAEPVMYDVAQPASAPPRASRINFGQKLLEKYGYKAGKGLGKNEDGIVEALKVVADKPRKFADAQGGGFQAPRGMGKIVGGKKAHGQEEEDLKYGPTSNTIVVVGLADGLDVDAENCKDDGGIRQRIGDMFSKQFGNIERVVPRQATTGNQNPVFIKFTDTISAIRAVNAIDAVDFRFEERSGTAKFYDADKFDQGIFE